MPVDISIDLLDENIKLFVGPFFLRIAHELPFSSHYPDANDLHKEIGQS
jgi:hypothetical protein